MNITIDDYNIYYKITGEGERTAVILQGWGTEAGMYDLVANAIADKYRVVQFDFPGFGGSDEPREPWNVSRYTDFFCEFMKALDIKEATLIGHSYGGRVIIKAATRKEVPFDIDKIVLIDSAGVLPVRTFKQKEKIRKYKILKALLVNRVFYTLFPEVVDEWRSRQGSADYKNATPIMRQCLVMAVNEDLTDRLPQIGQDTLLVWGDLDTATPMRDAHIMEEKIPHAGLVVLSGCGHFSYAEQPAKFTSILRSYLIG